NVNNTNLSSSYVRIGSEFFSSFRPVEETVSIHDETHRQTSSQAVSQSGGTSITASSTDNATSFQQSTSNANNGRRSRTLMGIFSSDSYNDATYRSRHRKLLNEIWKDARTCSVHEFLLMENESQRQQCQLLYTFIIGGAQEEDAPTERLEDTLTNPLTLSQIEKPMRSDVNNDDVTLLNIRENMNDGKSQTFFYYASTIMEKYQNTATPIEYAMKLDADAILHLHDFFMFAHEHLPPSPWNVNIFTGALRDKAGWAKDMHPQADLARYESYWGNEFDGVHLYLAGQCYLMSYDLCKFVAEEAPFSKTRIGKGGYLEGHEDHDVSAMVYHSPTPIHMITIGKSQRFWEHPVKGQPRWVRIEKRERARMNQQIFEGKLLRIY
ncbi:MAG: hypothetical protein SGILL_007594, partial [Bacillariaceae sp.]